MKKVYESPFVNIHKVALLATLTMSMDSELELDWNEGGDEYGG